MTNLNPPSAHRNVPTEEAHTKTSEAEADAKSIPPQKIGLPRPACITPGV